MGNTNGPAQAQPNWASVATAASGYLGNKASYSITANRAQAFAVMLGKVPGLQQALQAQATGVLQAQCAPGGRVNSVLSNKYSTPIKAYSTAQGYMQTNWLRGAIAVYLALQSVAQGAPQAQLGPGNPS